MNNKYNDNHPATPDNDDETQVKQLIADFKHGNQLAFSELVDRYHNQVTALAYKMVNDYDEAADIAQIVFVKMAKNIWRYDPSKKFYTWLYRVTVNASIDYIRKHRRHKHEPLESFHDITESAKSDPELSFRRRQLGDEIELAAESLSEKQRAAFLLRDVEGCKIDDVANMMNMPEATVRWYLHRARTRIRQELRHSCPQALKFLGVL